MCVQAAPGGEVEVAVEVAVEEEEDLASLEEDEGVVVEEVHTDHQMDMVDTEQSMKMINFMNSHKN